MVDENPSVIQKESNVINFRATQDELVLILNLKQLFNYSKTSDVIHQMFKNYSSLQAERNKKIKEWGDSGKLLQIQPHECPICH